MAFAPDGRYLALGGANDEINLYDLERGGPVHRVRMPIDEVTALAFSPDGQTLAAASSATATSSSGTSRPADRGRPCGPFVPGSQHRLHARWSIDRFGGKGESRDPDLGPVPRSAQDPWTCQAARSPRSPARRMVRNWRLSANGTRFTSGNGALDSSTDESRE